MLEENLFDVESDDEGFEEELALEFDASHDPEAVWEWDGSAWVAVAA
jgi:hypothetical protein